MCSQWPQKPNSSSVPSFTWIWEKWGTERKGVCDAKNEKTGKEECNKIEKMSMNDRMQQYKMKD